VGEEYPPHPRVALAEDLAGTLHRHLPHQGHGEGLELLGEVLAAPLPLWGHTVHLAVIAAAFSRQSAHDDALLVENVEVPRLHRLDMVAAGHMGPGPSTLLRPQVRRLLHLQKEGRGTCLKLSLPNTPCLSKLQQLNKHFLKCHHQPSSYGRQAPQFPLEIARNHKISLCFGQNLTTFYNSYNCDSLK
jgi:hypothetical protein